MKIFQFDFSSIYKQDKIIFPGKLLSCDSLWLVFVILQIESNWRKDSDFFATHFIKFHQYKVFIIKSKLSQVFTNYFFFTTFLTSQFFFFAISKEPSQFTHFIIKHCYTLVFNFINGFFFELNRKNIERLIFVW